MRLCVRVSLHASVHVYMRASFVTDIIYAHFVHICVSLYISKGLSIHALVRACVFVNACLLSYLHAGPLAHASLRMPGHLSAYTLVRLFVHASDI